MSTDTPQIDDGGQQPADTATGKLIVHIKRVRGGGHSISLLADGDPCDVLSRGGKRSFAERKAFARNLTHRYNTHDDLVKALQHTINLIDAGQTIEDLPFVRKLLEAEKEARS